MLFFIIVLSVAFNFLSFVLFNNENYGRLPEKRKEIFSGINLLILLLIGFISILPGAILEGLVFYKTIIK